MLPGLTLVLLIAWFLGFTMLGFGPLNHLLLVMALVVIGYRLMKNGRKQPSKARSRYTS